MWWTVSWPRIFFSLASPPLLVPFCTTHRLACLSFCCSSSPSPFPRLVSFLLLILLIYFTIVRLLPSLSPPTSSLLNLLPLFLSLYTSTSSFSLSLSLSSKRHHTHTPHTPYTQRTTLTVNTLHWDLHSSSSSSERCDTFYTPPSVNCFTHTPFHTIPNVFSFTITTTKEHRLVLRLCP